MIIVQTTYPDKKSAEAAASNIVKKKLAACVNVIRIESSHYVWKGKPRKEGEFFLIIKTAKANYRKLERWIMESHPYELPEIIRIDVSGGLPGYLAWVDKG